MPCHTVEYYKVCHQLTITETFHSKGMINKDNVERAHTNETALKKGVMKPYRLLYPTQL